MNEALKLKTFAGQLSNLINIITPPSSALTSTSPICCQKSETNVCYFKIIERYKIIEDYVTFALSLIKMDVTSQCCYCQNEMCTDYRDLNNSQIRG